MIVKVLKPVCGQLVLIAGATVHLVDCEYVRDLVKAGFIEEIPEAEERLKTKKKTTKENVVEEGASDE